ncbi:MAG: hypothetical protein HY293_00450 [Planctomycetes bacterium]|nr:hypothetical protein [Planctomycetota bacterium]
MSVSVYVMPLRTYLGGSIRTTWAGGASPPSMRRRTAEEVRLGFDAFGEQLGRLLAVRPDWDEEAPFRAALTFSLEHFAGPFLYARSQAYRRRLPILCALEAPQIWIPADFEPVFQVAPPWDPEKELTVASSPRLKSELERLAEWIDEEDREDLAEAGHVAGRLREFASLGIEHRTPVIVEG